MLKRIDQIFDAHFRGTAMQPVMEVARLHRVWAELVGEPWADAARPLRLYNGILFVSVADASWAQRLALEGRKLERVISRRLGYPITLRHRVVGRAESAPWTPVRPRFDDANVERAVAAAPEGPLRDALRRYFAYLAAHQERNGIAETTVEEKR